MENKNINTNEDKESTSEKGSKKAKKAIVVVLVSVLVLMVLLFSVSLLIDKYYEKKREEQSAPIDFDFCPADYSQNIFEDEEYMNLVSGGLILYTDSSSNLTLGVDMSSAVKYGDDVSFMVEYIYSIINGDVEAYNEFFSDAYYENNLPKEKFTMQKLYNINLTKISATDSEDGTHTEYVFSLEYQIMENNGSFRNDIGSGSKKQYIKISENNGRMLIDSISTSTFR